LTHADCEEKVERALAEYLEQVKLKNCKVNEGYLKALGLRRGVSRFCPRVIRMANARD
jgi:hypothetical protein